ncbi:unnamed protein product, partial [Nesidiocoris tenuis]
MAGAPCSWSSNANPLHGIRNSRNEVSDSDDRNTISVWATRSRTYIRNGRSPLEPNRTFFPVDRKFFFTGDFSTVESISR